MKKLLILSVAALLVAPVFAGTVTTVGNTDLEISGGLRIRWDYYNNIYDFTDHEDSATAQYQFPSDEYDDDFSYTPWRANVALKILVTRNVDVVIDIGDTGYFGMSGWGEEGFVAGPRHGVSPFGVWEPPYIDAYRVNGNGWIGEEIPNAGAGVNTQDDHFGLFEGYIHIRNAWDSNWSFKLGRQKSPLGNEFLMGDDNWYDGVSFDGLRSDWTTDMGDIAIFWYKVYTQTAFDIANEDDGNLYGVYTTWGVTDRQGVDAYVLHGNFNVAAVTGAANAGPMDFDTMTLGVRWFSKEAFAGFDWSAELAWQDNTWDPGTGLAKSKMDGGGIAFEGEVGYTFDSDYEPRLAFGLTYITGDDDMTDEDLDGFWRLFGDTHGRWGNADLLYSSALGFQTYDITSPFYHMANGVSSGAIIPQLNFTMKANDSIRWGANLVFFMAAESEFNLGDVNGLDGNDILDLDASIATELDAWLTYQYSEHFGTSFNLSYIAEGDRVAALADCNAGGFDPVTDKIDEAASKAGEDEAMRAYASFVAKW